jgi:hypothetical protein
METEEILKKVPIADPDGGAPPPAAPIFLPFRHCFKRQNVGWQFVAPIAAQQVNPLAIGLANEGGTGGPNEGN